MPRHIQADIVKIMGNNIIQINSYAVVNQGSAIVIREIRKISKRTRINKVITFIILKSCCTFVDIQSAIINTIVINIKLRHNLE